MKKLIAFIVVFALYQSWGKIESIFTPSLSKQQLAAAQANAQSSTKKVILYGTTWCGYCQKTREFLAENNITYTEFDIENSDEGRRRYDAINGSGVPVLEVNSSVIRGYAPEAILAALNPDNEVKTNE
ncbi:MAG: glutaredoxin family protein [Methylophilaceae bacterium]|nr:glutaredoxin family protein [Methylophilaceae bacterium]